MNVEEKIRESNRIENIHREATLDEIDIFYWFIQLQKLEIYHLEKFLKVYQPGAKLRDRYGLNVQVGKHRPPKGGPHIQEQLQALLDDANKCQGSNEAWEIHCQYETIHPFTDGNGRSGRMLWYWMMWPQGDRGFLHEFYYQTLNNYRRKI